MHGMGITSEIAQPIAQRGRESYGLVSTCPMINFSFQVIVDDKNVHMPFGVLFVEPGARSPLDGIPPLSPFACTPISSFPTFIKSQ